jgi:hypothetical protein
MEPEDSLPRPEEPATVGRRRDAWRRFASIVSCGVPRLLLANSEWRVGVVFPSLCLVAFLSS